MRSRLGFCGLSAALGFLVLTLSGCVSIESNDKAAERYGVLYARGAPILQYDYKAGRDCHQAFKQLVRLQAGEAYKQLVQTRLITHRCQAEPVDQLVYRGSETVVVTGEVYELRFADKAACIDWMAFETHRGPWPRQRVARCLD